MKSEANFYPRSPYGERQQMEHLKIPAHGISIHALLAESDISVFWTALSRPLFLSTLSLRRATHYDNYNLHCVEISIHALLAESDGIGLVFLWWGVRISIHALLAESDGGCSPGRATAGISIHALLAESDKLEKYGIKMQGLFLSTLSLRRATLELFLYYQDNTISIHALLAESDHS